MTCLSAKFCKHAKDCDIHMCSNTIEKCRAFNRKPNNNEEWLRTCTTEELAEQLWEIYNAGKNDAKTYDCFEFFMDKDDAIEWLKEIHE